MLKQNTYWLKITSDENEDLKVGLVEVGFD